MRCHEEGAELTESLRELLDRLCAPDLTLGEAKTLRARLLGTLDRIEWDPLPAETASVQTKRLAQLSADWQSIAPPTRSPTT